MRGNEYAMIDSTIVRTHQHAAGAQEGRNLKPLADQKADEVPKSIPNATHWEI
jgi:hypothetical protein